MKHNKSFGTRKHPEFFFPVCGIIISSLCYLFFTTGLITFLLPCYTQGKNAELVGENCLTHGIFAIIPLLNIYCHATIRGRIREKKNIDVRQTLQHCNTYRLLIEVEEYFLIILFTSF